MRSKRDPLGADVSLLARFAPMAGLRASEVQSKLTHSTAARLALSASWTYSGSTCGFVFGATIVRKGVDGKAKDT